MGISMLGNGQHTGAVCVKYCLRVGRDAAQTIMIYDRSWIGHDNTVIGLEDNRIADPGDGPGIMDVFMLQLGNNRVIISSRNWTRSRLIGRIWISQHIGRYLGRNVSEQYCKQ